LRESFYADAGEFIQELRDRRERAAERADDPFDAPEIDRLTSEINAAEETVEAIYEKRLGKLVKAASLAAADMPAGTDGMTAEEKQLFDTLVGDIRANRERVLDVLAGEQSAADGPAEDASSPGADGDAGSADNDNGTASRAAEPNSERVAERSQAESEQGQNHEGSRTRADDGESPTADVDRARVRITTDVGVFFGVDQREYDLSENDVVQLPSENAEPLLDRDAAERL
jgi:Uncharacterized protein conserved in archaea